MKQGSGDEDGAVVAKRRSMAESTDGRRDDDAVNDRARQ